MKKHGVTHHILTKSQPMFSKTRRLSLEKLEIVKSEISNLIEQGIMRPSKSSWASPIHLVPKANGEFAVIFADSMLKQFQINTLYLIFTIFLMLYIIKKYFQNLI